MNNLQAGDTGRYWCAVEIYVLPDVNEYLYITVKPDPDLSVKESRVRGEVEGSITVQCLYREAYKDKQKQWCRFKDKNCNTFRDSKASQNSAVQLIDDGRGSFSVEMSRLKKSDAGWYWCSAGDLQVPVHISVRDPPPVVTKTVTTTTHHVSIYISVPAHISAAHATTVSVSEETTGSKTLKIWYLIFFFLLLVILIIIICMLRMKCKFLKAEDQIRTRTRSNDTTLHTFSASKVKDQDVTYLNFTCKNKTVSPNNEDDDDKIIYSSVVCR
ncbi:uncharacterized protein Hap1MRO34_000498 isoform 2-T2 [Clarias gariepinus]